MIAQVLMGPSKQLKQMIEIENNIVKNPNWSEANQLAICKRVRGFQLLATKKQIQIVVRAGLEPRTTGLRVCHPNHTAKYGLKALTTEVNFTEGIKTKYNFVLLVLSHQTSSSQYYFFFIIYLADNSSGP